MRLDEMILVEIADAYEENFPFFIIWNGVVVNVTLRATSLLFTPNVLVIDEDGTTYEVPASSVTTNRPDVTNLNVKS